jgi:hypothetical protein
MPAARQSTRVSDIAFAVSAMMDRRPTSGQRATIARLAVRQSTPGGLREFFAPRTTGKDLAMSRSDCKLKREFATQLWPCIHAKACIPTGRNTPQREKSDKDREGDDG